ncbi:MAG: hypothetical protein CV087_12990 [Candidatus Brocadia sp. WS118]|nr:MAG: hypothetical protein CV087_12990 [Candidatus Brocadia sp. WS118]
MKDPIVEEVREARKKHAQRFNFDLRAICADLKMKEKEYGLPIKSLPSKTVQTAASNNMST